MIPKKKNYDVVVIGGGFYGSVLACYLKKRRNSVLLVEKENNLLKRASWANQARIHNGYHYPRSFLTAYRSHLNYLRFIKDFKASVYRDFGQYYALASTLSKTTAKQFYKFAKQLGAFIAPAPEAVKKLFNPNTIDDVFAVDEIVFDAQILVDALAKRLAKLKIEVLLGVRVDRVGPGDGGGISITLAGGRKIWAGAVFNCTYSGINKILRESGLPLLPFKQEFIEMPLIKVPGELRNLGISIFDGPFFGFLPFPARACHSIWHVRYSIRANWLDPARNGTEEKLKKLSQKSNWNFIKKDAQRFIPLFSKVEYLDSLYEIKTVLPETEESDARPILFRRDYGLPGFHIIMGSKIDNIYDIIERVKEEKLT